MESLSIRNNTTLTISSGRMILGLLKLSWILGVVMAGADDGPGDADFK